MRILPALTALIGVLAAVCGGSTSGQVSPTTTFMVRDVRVFDGERTIERANVVLRDGVIATVGEESIEPGIGAVLDGRGRTLLPGLIDGHVHVADDAESALEQALVMGVTTVLDMFSAGDRLSRIKRIQAADPPHAADVRTAGTGATAPGGHPTQMGGGPTFPTIAGAEEADAFVEARIAEGSDYIKIIYDDLSGLGREPLPMLSRATLDALVAAAHRRGKLVVVHSLSEWQARHAIEAGADVLVHLFGGATVLPDFGQYAAEHGVAVMPTLSVVCPRGEAQALLADKHLSALLQPRWRQMLQIPRKRVECGGTEAAIKQLIAARVPTLAGTDAPSPGTTYGASMHGELSLLTRSGLSPTQALAAATSVPARVFRVNDRGAIRPGLRADLLLVDGDPTRDIRDTRRIVDVWKRGVAVGR
jgi:imidazolonepropionase-like amidohydrolase